MAEQIISKRCRICKQTKTLSEFHKSKIARDGRQSSCKACQKIYRQSPKGREVQHKAHRKYNQSERGKVKNKAYSQTEKFKDYHKQYSQTEKGKATHKTAQKRYRQSEKFKIVQKRYRQSEKGKAHEKQYNYYYRQTEWGKLYRRLGMKRWRLRHPEQHKAGIAVREAIRIGQLLRPDSLECYYCYEQAKQYHHWKGYAPEHWLDVIPVCQKCHTFEHCKAS